MKRKLILIILMLSFVGLSIAQNAPELPVANQPETGILNYKILGISIKVILLAFAFVFAGFLCKKVSGVILEKLLNITTKTRFSFDELIIKSIDKPIGWACVIAGVYFAISVLDLPKEPVDIQLFVNKLAISSSVVLMIWLSLRILDNFTSLWLEKTKKTESKLDDQMVPIIRKSGRVFLIIIGIVLVLQNVGYNVGSLLAGLGIGGLAFGFASKDTLSNFFGSIVIFFDRPFGIGDWVVCGDVEGTVEEIGLRSTKIRTFANSLITIPNAKFTPTPINNWSRMQKRRIKMSVGVTYSTTADQLDEAVRKIREIIANDENIRDDFYLVNFDNFGACSLDIFIYCFTKTTVWAEFLEAKQNFMLTVMRTLEDMGIEIAFPTQTIHMANLPQEFNKYETMGNDRPM